jgi:hypothetical protein
MVRRGGMAPEQAEKKPNVFGQHSAEKKNWSRRPYSLFSLKGFSHDTTS